jgi:hypothetical protein
VEPISAGFEAAYWIAFAFEPVEFGEGALFAVDGLGWSSPRFRECVLIL